MSYLPASSAWFNFNSCLEGSATSTGDAGERSLPTGSWQRPSLAPMRPAWPSSVKIAGGAAARASVTNALLGSASG